eukprot:6199687-Pleurochrysis_carterae.AAC.1
MTSSRESGSQASSRSSTATIELRSSPPTSVADLVKTSVLPSARHTTCPPMSVPAGSIWSSTYFVYVTEAIVKTCTVANLAISCKKACTPSRKRTQYRDVTA